MRYRPEIVSTQKRHIRIKHDYGAFVFLGLLFDVGRGKTMLA